MQTQRGYYGPRHGIVDVNFEWDAFHVDSAVFASISEAHREGVLSGGRDARRFHGAASLEVLNVVPRDGGCTARVRIEWDSGLWFAVDFFLFN